MSGQLSSRLLAIGFAISITTATLADDPIPAFLPQGRSQAFLGVVSMPNAAGAIVSSVVPQSSAFEIGIESGDIIEEIDGFRIGVINGATYSLPSEIRRSGEEIDLVIRDRNSGTTYARRAKVGGRATNKGTPGGVPRLGVSSQANGQGETLAQVFPNSAAASIGLMPGDLITHVDGYRIGIIDGNTYSLASEIRHSPSGCTLTIMRGSGAQNLVVNFGPRPIVTARVHALLIGLSDDPKIGAGISANLDMMQSLIANIPGSKLGIVRRIDGDNCRATIILNEIRNLGIGADEAVFVYYAGHGAYDPTITMAQDASGGHFLQIPNGDLRRSTIWDALTAKGARLTVLLTDTCNAPALPIDVAAAPFPPMGEHPITTLLLRHRGEVDISGSARGQYGWYKPVGGIFTSAWVNAVIGSSGNWGDVLRSSSSGTNQLYRSLKQAALAAPNLNQDLRTYLLNQSDQFPQAFRLDVRQD